MLKSSSQKNYSSFTLIEVVFAVGIILIFLGSLIAIFNVGTKNAVVSKHRLQAANLARGAVEIAREVRDTAKVRGVNWNQMDADCWLPGSLSGVINHPRNDCSGNRLGFSANPDTLTYNQVTFTRQVQIINLSGSDTKKITATVSWDDYGQSHSVTMVTYLTNY
jgi:type II secretory pathway pseudopilin PulG